MRILKLSVLSLMLWLVSFNTSALDVPAHPMGRVSDYAGILSIGTAKTLTQELKDYEDKTTNQVVVATFRSLKGDSLEDFSMRLAEKWKIGQEGSDNGVILLIFSKDRKMRIEVGYGVESLLTDARSGYIIRKVIAPEFRKGNFDKGVSQAVSVIMGSLDQTFIIPKSKKKEYKPTFKGVASMILVLLFFITMIGSWFFPSSFSSGRSSSSSGGSFSGSSGGSSFSGGGGSFGGGGASGGW